MMIWIDNETKKRVNIHAAYKGRSKLDTPEIRAAVGVIEIEDDPEPNDFSYDTYTVREDWEATQRPYTIYTKRPAPTKAERMKKATAIYKDDLAGLQDQYLAALFSGENQIALDLQDELAERRAEYQAELAEIRSA